MEEQGYDTDYAVAVTAGSSMLSPIIPPSIAFILYSYYTEVPVGRMFMGGLVPGIIIGLMQMVVVYVMYVQRGYNFQSGKFSLKVLLVTAFHSIGALLMPLIILSGIVFGIVTPTESGVLAILYGLFYGFVISRTLKLKDLPAIILESAVTTSVVYMTIAAAGVLSNVLVRLHFQTEVQNFAINFLANPALAVAFLFFVFVILGMFLDPTVIIAMFATTTLMIGNAFGFDPVHFGVVMTIVMQLGAITPPVGTFLFISCGVGKLPMEKAIKPLLPYIGTIVLAMILAMIFPQIVTWLPNLIYNK